MTTADITRITGFIKSIVGDKDIVLGVSGGIDSAVCLHLCTRVVGSDRVIAVHLPSAITPSQDTLLAGQECKRLGVLMKTYQITNIVTPVIAKIRSPILKTTRGNAAARARMMVLYAFANNNNGLVCGTGNRTEYFLGYTTKFGDNAADFYPILHLLKTEVWGLAKELGVSEEIITKPPSAGLWAGQTDEDEIGMSYYEMDKEIFRYLNGTGKIDPRLLDLHQKNQHKSEPGRSLLSGRW